MAFTTTTNSQARADEEEERERERERARRHRKGRHNSRAVGSFLGSSEDVGEVEEGAR